ncbi:MBL fold metallo-hydrolase [Flectobacillus major]|uniref:MBL fold metallo-hydrolase n=1 Tax=Flectobacillus major TaxID=103 RepID=UPI00041E1D07|nr:MBL fold metallo-hydrolase [Flectobacillus major]
MQQLSIKKHHPVEGYELGYHWPGFPTFTVHIYWLDGLLIDTAQYNCRHNVNHIFANKPLEQIALTHWHEDHIGNVASLYQKHHPRVWAHPFTANKIRHGFDIMLYEKYFFGKVRPHVFPIQNIPQFIQTPHYQLETIHTPGHSVDHHVFIEKQHGWLFSGDLFVSQKIKVFRKGENIWQQIHSIQRVLQEDFEQLFCAHNPQLKHGKQALSQKLQYFEDFTGSVLQWHQEGYNTVEIIQKMQLKEKTWINIMTAFDVSVRWMVGSVIKHLPTT